MAKTSKKQSEKSKAPKEKKPFFSPRNKIFFGLVMVLFSVALLLSFISFYIYGTADQSVLADFSDRSEKARNWLGKFGAFLADVFLYKGFGVASFLFVRLLFLTGVYLFLDLPSPRLKKTWFWDLFAVIVLSVLFGFFHEKLPELGGVFGFEMNAFLQDYLGKAGTMLVLVLGVLIYLIFKIKLSPDKIRIFVKNRQNQLKEELGKIKENVTPPVSSEKQISTRIDDPLWEDEQEEELEEITLKTVAEETQPLTDFEKNIDDDK